MCVYVLKRKCENENRPHVDYLCIFYLSAIRKHNRLLMYIADFKQQLDYLRKLINIISVQNLTQVLTILLPFSCGHNIFQIWYKINCLKHCKYCICVFNILKFIISSHFMTHFLPIRSHLNLKLKEYLQKEKKIYFIQYI